MFTMLTLSLGEKLGLHSINLLNKVMGCVKHSRKFSHGNKWDVAFQRVKKVNCCFSPDIGPIQIRQAFGWRAATNIHFRCLLVYLQSILWGGYYYPHLKLENLKVQRRKATCQRSRSSNLSIGHSHWLESLCFSLPPIPIRSSDTCFHVTSSSSLS